MAVLASAIGVTSIASMLSCGSSASPSDARPWQLVWSDEFDAADLDRSTWTLETRAGSGTPPRAHDPQSPQTAGVTRGAPGRNGQAGRTGWERGVGGTLLSELLDGQVQTVASVEGG